MTSKQKKEYTCRISQANRSELIVILYEMFLNYVEDACMADEREERSAFRESIRKARGCVNELMSSLDFSYGLSQQLFQLYAYVNKELACADVRNQREPLSHCRLVMNSLLEAFREVSRQDTSGPVMENVQAVYAGLTYGRGELNESLANEGISRGLFA